MGRPLTPAKNPRAERMRQTRLDRGVSVAAVAEQLGVSVHTVRDWERGDHEPSMSMLLAYCALLSLDPMDLHRCG